MRCFYSESYHVDLPAGHVFPMAKFRLAADALRRDARLEIIDAGPAGRADLLRVHTPAYVAAVERAELPERAAKKLGLPPSAALCRRSYAAVGGTLAAARVALADGLACNLAGGTHHSFADRGEGFCVFNDVAVAIRALRLGEPYLQAMVVDLDAHQGNGTNAIFADDSSVFTYDLHVGRNYPSAKVPASLDVPLERWATADAYFSALHATLPAAVERFEPDVVFYIAGVDPHEADKFGQMKLTTTDLAERDRWVIDLLRNWTIPTIVLYGGGYQPTADQTAALHANAVRTAATRRANEQRTADQQRPQPRTADHEARP